MCVELLGVDAVGGVHHPPGLGLHRSALARTGGHDVARNLAVEVIPRAGHMLAEEAPEAVLAAAQRFLA